MTDEKHEKKRRDATTLLNSVRGQYIIGQALYLAIESIEARPEHEQEPSNVADMRLLMEGLFPIYAAAERVTAHFKREG